MIQIVQLHGTDKKLYELVAPLVMSPEVLKQNYNTLSGHRKSTSGLLLWIINMLRFCAGGAQEV